MQTSKLSKYTFIISATSAWTKSMVSVYVLLSRSQGPFHISLGLFCCSVLDSSSKTVEDSVESYELKLF